MMRAIWRALVCAALLAAAACGDSGMGPSPPPPPPPPPVNNTAPVIEALTVRVPRAGAPANFADVSDRLEVTATVTDAETAASQLTYNWSAPLGVFSGTGASVTWQAPATTDAPRDVTLTLEVVERYGASQEHRVTRTAQVRLHDTAREVGDQARTFLDRFSQPQNIRDWRVVMADFSPAACPDPGDVESERLDVEAHIANFVMNNYTIGAARVTISFGSACSVPQRQPLRGDACVVVPVVWDSTNQTTRVRAVSAGDDYLSAAYSRTDRRWYLCASQFIGTSTAGHAFYSR